jgi:hypothetical protein
MTARQGSRNSSRELGKLKRESTARKASAVVKGLLAWGPLYQAGAGINVCVFFFWEFLFLVKVAIIDRKMPKNLWFP